MEFDDDWGEESLPAIAKVKGQIIEDIFFNGEELEIKMENQQTLNLRDGGQSCCESRYLNCDDDVQAFVGAEFLTAELLYGDGMGKGKYFSDNHEVAFLIVRTSLGDFTVETHNEHNGYYGGFSIFASLC